MVKKPDHEGFKRSIKALDKYEALQALLNATMESAVLIDMEGKILALNHVAAQRLGKSADELIGVCVDDYFPPDVAKSRKIIRDEIVRTGKPVRFQDERDGRALDNNVYPVFDVDKKIIGIAVYGMDITARKQAEADITTAYEEIKELKELLETESAYLQEEIRLEHNFENIIGMSQALKYVLYRAEQVGQIYDWRVL